MELYNELKEETADDHQERRQRSRPSEHISPSVVGTAS